MKKFNLKAALSGHPICTRDGHPARILATDLKGPDKTNRLAVAVDKGGKEEVLAVYEDGRTWKNSDHEWDIVMAPVDTPVWINIYVDRDGRIFAFPHLDKGDAEVEDYPDGDWVKTIETKIKI